MHLLELEGVVRPPVVQVVAHTANHQAQLLDICKTVCEFFRMLKKQLPELKQHRSSETDFVEIKILLSTLHN